MADKKTSPKIAVSKSAISLSQSGILQPKCKCGVTSGLTRKCETCNNQRLSRKQVTNSSLSNQDVVSPSGIIQTPAGQPIGYSFSNISVQPQSKTQIQTKLTIGQPDDQYEQEADRVADQVMRMPEPFVQRQTDSTEDEELIQTKSVAQRSSTSPLQAGKDLESQLSSTKGGGSPLPDEVRSFMEPRFGHDFSQVRVHTDDKAVQMNRELGAQAFTHGSDIYYGTGKAPANDELTGHELTHVMQQVGSNAGKVNLLEEQTPTVQRWGDGWFDGLFGNEDETSEEEYSSSEEESYEEDGYTNGTSEDDEDAYDTDTSVEEVEKLTASQWMSEYDDDIPYSDSLSGSFLEAYKKRVTILIDYNPEADKLISENEFYSLLVPAIDEFSLRGWLGEDEWKYTELEAFPQSWSIEIQRDLKLQVDVEALKKTLTIKQDFRDKLAKQLPEDIYNEGLPLTSEEILGLKGSFDLSPKFADPPYIQYIVGRYSTAARDCAQAAYTIHIYQSWEKIRENMASAALQGNFPVDDGDDWEKFASRARGLVTDALAKFHLPGDEEKSATSTELPAQEKNTLTMLAGALVLGGLTAGMANWEEAKILFFEKLDEADQKVAGASSLDRILLGLKWSVDRGYLQAAGQELIQTLKANGTAILEDLALEIGKGWLMSLLPGGKVGLAIEESAEAAIAATELAESIGTTIDSILMLGEQKTVVALQKSAASLTTKLQGPVLDLLISALTTFLGRRKSGKSKSGKPDKAGKLQKREERENEAFILARVLTEVYDARDIRIDKLKRDLNREVGRKYGVRYETSKITSQPGHYKVIQRTSKTVTDKYTPGEEPGSKKKGDYSYGKVATFGAAQRATSARGWLVNKPAPRNESAQKKVWKGLEGEWDGSHLIPSRFGGSGEIENLIPANSRINESFMKTLENRIGELLEEGEDLYMEVDVKGSSRVPDSVHYKIFKRESDGSLSMVFDTDMTPSANPSSTMGKAVPGGGKKFYEPGSGGTKGGEEPN